MPDEEGMKPLLLVEDDPISRSFMSTALSALGVDIDAVETAVQALAQDRMRGHALWLIDAHLPDGRGEDLLAELRGRRPGVPALAHTADPSPAMRASLLAAGFADVLVKPLSAEALQSAVRARLPAADWDEAAALRALNGNREHVATLRKLFVDELPATLDHVEQAARAGDLAGLRASLHKLRASCGFVGAARLGQTVQALQAQLDSAEGLARFDQVARETIELAG